MRKQLLVLVATLFLCCDVYANTNIPCSHPPMSSIDAEGVSFIENVKYNPKDLTFNPQKNLFCSSYTKYDANGMESGISEFCMSDKELPKLSFDIEAQKNVLTSSNIKFDDSIEKYFSIALHNELKFIGVKNVSSSKIKIFAEIEKFILDKSYADSNKFTIEVKFIIEDIENKKEIFNESLVGEYIYNNFDLMFDHLPQDHISISNSIHTSTSRVVEKFVLSAQASGIFK